ncbi:MAG: hypothetical protein WC648_05240 [Candidatus Paceibacterota bacterium]
MILTAVTGTYVNDENLQVSAATKAVADGTATSRGALTDALDDTYLQTAIEYTRTQIAAVPGSGSILGQVWQYNGIKYAFRNNAGDTAAAMYKSSATGWVLCDMGRTVAFTSGGTTEITENTALVGATSGATATAKRILLTSGTWAGGDAAGTLILYTQVGTFQAENLNISGGAANVATIGANSTAVTLTKGGFYRFVNYNFRGSTDTFRMYGCDGVNKAFEWDGATFVQLTTGMTLDKPTHIAAFRNHLFLAFGGGSLQHSSPGNPYSWSAVTGATELGIGDDITDIIEMPGPALVVWARNSMWTLTGTHIDDWVLSAYSYQVGAIENTVQRIGPGIFLDDRGLTTLSTAQEYGNFKDAVISKRIEPILTAKKDQVQCSVAIKDKNQYRLFFDDMTVITMTMSGGKIMGFTRQEYGVQPLAVTSTEDANGYEELFFGTSTGFVYQLDKGTSFNGNAIRTICRTHYNHLQTPRNRKRIRKLIFELDAPTETTIYAGVEYDYSGTEAGGLIDIEATGGIWGVSNWGAFVYGGETVATAEVDITGNGKNFCIIFTSELTYEEPHTLQGITVLYDVYGMVR